MQDPPAGHHAARGNNNRGKHASLIFFDCSEVNAKVKLGQSVGEPYFLISSVPVAIFLGVLHENLNGLNRHGAVAKTGIRGICPDSISSLRMKMNFCVRSTANAGTMTLPPRDDGLA